MNVSRINPFDDLFEDDKYVLLKNYLYSYLLRKQAVEKNIRDKNSGLILEVGSGLATMIISSDTIFYSELSLSGLRTLKHRHSKGWYVVADATHLPFRSDAFAYTVCSEVLVHSSHLIWVIKISFENKGTGKLYLRLLKFICYEDCAVVGAESVLNADIPAYSIVAGVPAQVI